MKQTKYLLVPALFLMATTANASIIIDTDQAASGSLGIVLAVDGTGSTVFGEVGGTTTVQLDGTESLIATGGQSQFESSDGLFTSLNITVPGFNFDRLVFRIFDPVADGTVTITATDTFGNVFQTTLALSDNPSGDFFNVDSDDLQQISAVSFETSQGIESVRQVRVGGLAEDINVVPEPGTYALLASGLGLCALWKRRTKVS